MGNKFTNNRIPLISWENAHDVQPPDYSGSHLLRYPRKNIPWEYEKEYYFDLKYFNQSYISSIFSLEGREYSEALMRYFKIAFDDVEEIDQLGIEAENISNFANLFEEEQAISYGNISGLVEKYVIDRNDFLNIQIKKGIKPKTAKEMIDFDYLQCLERVNNGINKALPKFLRGNKEVESAISMLDRVVLEQSSIERVRYLTKEKPVADLVDAFYTKKDELSKAQADRNEVEREFERTFASKASGIRNRVAIVRAYLAAEEGFQSQYRRYGNKPGKEKDAFRFVKALDITSPIEYFMNQCDESFTVEKVPTAKRDLGHLKDYIEASCFNEEGYKAGHSWEALYSSLKNSS